MKFLKGLLITLVALFLVYVLLAVFSPKEYSVTRELEVDASKEAVWSQINTFEKWQAWSPWKEKDSTLTSTFEGSAGTIGSKTTWIGDPELSGTGSMTLKESVPNEKIVYDLEFPEWESVSEGYIALEETESGGTKMTWNDKGALPFLMRPMGMFGMFDKMMGPDFEKGLENIGKVASIAKPEKKGIEMSEVELPEITYLGVRHKTTMAEVMTQEFFATNYQNIFTTVGKENIQVAGNSACIYYSWNEVDSTAEAFPCVPISAKPETTPEGMEAVVIPAGNVVKATYYGSYENGMEAHLKIDEYCKEKGLKTGLVIEEYVNAATAESDDDLITNIFYYIIED